MDLHLLAGDTSMHQIGQTMQILKNITTAQRIEQAPDCDKYQKKKYSQETTLGGEILKPMGTGLLAAM